MYRIKSRFAGGIKAEVALPGWLRSIINDSESRVTTARGSFKSVPLLFRAVRLRCNSLTRVPAYVYDGEKIIDWPFEGTLSLQDFLWKNEAALLLAGYATNLKLSKAIELNNLTYQLDYQGLSWLNPWTVEIREDGGRVTFLQRVKGGQIGPFTEEQMFFMREFNPDDDIGKGTVAAEVALGNSQTMYHVTRFFVEYFKGGALPFGTFAMETDDEEELKKAETFFDRAMKGIGKRFLGLRGKGLEVKTITPELKSFQTDKLDNHSIEGIAWAMDIPKSVLTSDSANYATADVERKIYLTDTIIPRCQKFESDTNKQLLNPLGLKLVFAPEELPEMQEEEAQRATALKALRDSGVPLLAGLDMLGYDISENAMALIKAKEAVIPADMGGEIGKLPLAIQQLALARTRADESGDKVLSKQLADKIDELLGGLRAPSIISPTVKSELDKWHRKSVNRFRGYKTAVVDYDSDKIPPHLHAAVMGGLSAARSEADIHTFFSIFGNGSM